MKTIKKRKKKSAYEDARSIFRVRWKLLKGEGILVRAEGYINIPANDDQDAINRFKQTYNIAGRKFKVISVTEKQTK